jgi:hypothetical protein
VRLEGSTQAGQSLEEQRQRDSKLVAIAMTSAESRTERYREAERALWDYYGLEATERFIDPHSPAVRLRVLEVGSGEPLLFVPGTAGTGPYWGSLVRELPGSAVSCSTDPAGV